MCRRIGLALLLLTAALRAEALEYTDIWYTPAESGWGVNLVQSNLTQFLTFFVYGPNSQPTWLIATTTDDGSGAYSGALYATTGTYYGSPWGGVQGGAVGTVSFTPIDIYHATLAYTLTGGPSVTKTIQRQTLTPYVLSGNYSGSSAGKVTTCNNAAGNLAVVRTRYNLAVTQTADDSATLTFTFVDSVYSGTVCTLSGPLTHLGRLYQMKDAQYSCTGPGFSAGPVTATIDSLHPTGQGIEGRWTAVTTDGCTQSMRFAAVL
jgi:hypothetical protein